ncbi:MAG TPA: hypothetical protein VGM57_05720 [Pseudolabrys sp.]|jgi:hypothetical protein
MRSFLLAAPFLVLLSASGSAQQITIQNRPADLAQKGEIRIQVNMNFFVPGAVNNTEASLKAQEDARKALYASAGRECEVLKEVLASECRIESVNVNVNRNYGQPMNEGFTANGSFGFRVTLK